MRIVFIRHGHPNYKEDCLTELGHLQAEAAAERVSQESPRRIFASTCGRALETAEHIARRFSLPVEPLEFMREISWGGIDGEIPLNGHPWLVVNDMVLKGQSIWEENWAQESPFCHNKVVEKIHCVQESFDRWIAELGYVREGRYYRAVGGNAHTYFLVSHGGSSMAVMSHLMSIPFPLACRVIRPDFTAVSVFHFPSDADTLVCPKIELLNDARHIMGVAVEDPV